MGLWHVMYEDWQMECCGEPFAVGDEVSWPLVLEDAGDVHGGGWHDQLTKICGPVEDVRDGADRVRVVREDSGLVVALRGEQGDGLRRGDRIRVVGVLSVERHGSQWPEVAGRVRAVQVLTQGFAETAPGSRTLEPVPGERSLRSVPRCPKRFADREITPAPDGRERRRVESAAVVTLEVPGTDSWLSHAVRRAGGGAEPTPQLLETLSTVREPL